VKIQGVTIALGADATGIETALKDVEKASAKTGKELGQINRALKFDPGNTELLRQKFEVLQDSVKNTTTKLDALKQAQAEVNRQFEAGEIDAGQFRAFNRELQVTEGRLESLQDQAKQTDIKIKADVNTSGIQRAEQDIESLGDAAKETGRKIGDSLSKGAAVDSAAIGGLVTGMQETNIQLAMLETQAANAGSGLRTFGNGSKKMNEEELANYEDNLEGQESKLEETLNNRADALADSYDEQKDALNKSLDKEYDSVAKAYDKKESALEKSLNDEMEALEEASDKKMKLIDKEYLEKIKLIDEERYNKLKAIDDEINGLKGLNEAEDKAAKSREDAEKRGELNGDISNARTKKGRRIALEKLQEFEAKLRAEQAQEERDNQIDALGLQKDGINEAFDKKKDAIKTEFDLRKEQASQEIQINKEALQEKQAIEMESFKAINQSKLESLKEQNDESKKMFDKRLSTELEATKKAHQEELASFIKMNEEKVETAKKTPVEQPTVLNVKTDVKGLEMEDIKKARTNFATVGQEVEQITEAMGNLIQAGYTTEEELDGVSKGISGAIVKYGETFSSEGLAESIATTSQLGEVTGQLTDLMEKSGVDVEGFNTKLQGMSSIQERSNAIAEMFADQGLNSLYEQYIKMNPEVAKNAIAQQEFQTATAELAEVLTPFVTEVTKVITAFAEFASENETLTKIMAVVMAVITAISGAFFILSPIIGGVIKLWPLLTRGATLVAAALGAITAPVAIVIGIILALIAVFVLVVKNWDWIKEKAVEFGEFMGGVFSAMGDAIANVFTGLWDRITAIWDGIKEGIKWAINGILGLINDFIGGMNKLKIPEWVPIVGGKGVDIPKIPMLAKGTDYFQGGMAIVGEQGPELVQMPKGSKVTPNDKTMGMMGGNVTVQQLVVREEADINRIARKLHDMQQVDRRGR
jgi:phage-related minor tail protein